MLRCEPVHRREVKGEVGDAQLPDAQIAVLEVTGYALFLRDPAAAELRRARGERDSR